MARYRNRRYRRNRRYKRSRLSNRNVFGHKSATAQASQIATLRNRVNRVYRICRPETKSHYEHSSTGYLSRHAGDYTFLGYGDVPIPRTAGDDGRSGDKITGFTRYYLQLQYLTTTGDPIPDTPAGATIRVIIGRYKIPHETIVYPNPGVLLQDYGTLNEQYQLNTIMPLRVGVTEDFIINYDKTYHISFDKPTLSLKLKSKKFIRRFDDDGSGASDNDSNHTFCVIIASGMSIDDENYDRIRVDVAKKCVFTDC